jgi:hypothetical protein
MKKIYIFHRFVGVFSPLKNWVRKLQKRLGPQIANPQIATFAKDLQI